MRKLPYRTGKFCLPMRALDVACFGRPATWKLAFFIALAIFPLISRAADITLQGNFTADDSVQLFSITLAAPAAVDFRSYGYAGGTTSTGTVVPSGGFDTILTLFDAGGDFLTDNDEGSGVATDPSTGLAADARITTNLTPGTYVVALTQFDSFSIGNLADGFDEAGHPNFTADPTFTTGGPCPGNMFRDISGTAGRCRNGDWTVDFVNVARVKPVAPVPEPSALLLAGAGLVLLLMGCGRHRRKAAALVGGLVAMIAVVPVQAQTNSGPDYSKVLDFLNGQRTLIDVTDLQVASYQEDPKRFSYTVALSPITTSNSQQANQPIPPNNNFTGLGYGPTPLLSFSARMFNQQAITITTQNGVYEGGAPQLQLLLENSSTGEAATWPVGTAQHNDQKARCGAVADFTGDGYDDFAINTDDGALVMLTPKNVNDMQGGFNSGVWKLKTAGTPIGSKQLLDMTAGDFQENGTQQMGIIGTHEIVGVSAAPNGGLELDLWALRVNHGYSPQSLYTGILTTPGGSPSSPITHASIARGRFNNSNHDQLVVAFATDSGPTYGEIIDFGPERYINPFEASPAVVLSRGVAISTGFIQVKTGQFALPGNRYDQIAYQSASPSSGGQIFFEILSVNPTNLTITTNKPVYSQFGCSYGITIGNFDNQQPDPLNPGKNEHNPNDQIAFLGGTCDNGEKVLSIYSVDPTSFGLTSESVNHLQLPPDPSGFPFPPEISLVATDLQGRSLVLGNPMLIRISSTAQPSVAIGAPPMHVDFVSPNLGAAPRVLNLSAVPEGFKTTYEEETSTSSTSSATNTTSWSFGTAVSLSASTAIGDPDLTGVKVSDTLTAAQELKEISEESHGTYMEKTFNLSATTAFGDELSFLDPQFNIWVYPVLGKKVCPAAKPNCQPNQQVPLTIQFSAPSGDALTQAAEGEAVQWYQPPWEPGNILSYPTTLKQLQLIYPHLSQLTNSVEFLTDSSVIKEKTTWSVSSDKTATTSVKQNNSFDNSFSASGKVDFLIGESEASSQLDLSGSFGLSNLIKDTTSLGLSTGIEITKPGTFPAFQKYAYLIAPYIMGTTQPGGVVDSHPLTTDVRTFGVLRTMFTADPLASDAGGWWQQAYQQAPDVALNHPSRWYISTPGLTNPIPDNCLATGLGSSQMDCAVLSQRSPDNPWLSVFHYMRGFFISSAAFPGQGPQLEVADAGDVLTLQARVYNYSLKEMPGGSKVHVRFYFQPVKNSLPAGDSVLIGEAQLIPIPPFSDVDGAPLNWVLASTTFDTTNYEETKHGNVDVLFWVVVWMEDANGSLVPEMPGHGLTAIPGTLKSMADVAEECQSDGNCYSNNLGIYRQPFHIFPSATLRGVSGPLPATSVDIGKVDLSSREITPKETVVVSASLLASGADAADISLNLYDGDPQESGRLF